MLTQYKKAKMQLQTTQNKSTRKKTNEPKTIQLANKKIEDMSIYYGLAIQRHADSIEDIRNACVGDILSHDFYE